MTSKTGPCPNILSVSNSIPLRTPWLTAKSWGMDRVAMQSRTGCALHKAESQPSSPSPSQGGHLSKGLFFFLIPTKILYRLLCLGGRRLWKQLCSLTEWTVEQLSDPILLHKLCKEAWLSTYATEPTRWPGRVGLWNEQLILLGDWSHDFMSVWDWAMTTVRQRCPSWELQPSPDASPACELPHVWAGYPFGKEYYYNPRARRDPKKSVVLC